MKALFRGVLIFGVFKLGVKQNKTTVVLITIRKDLHVS